MTNNFFLLQTIDEERPYTDEELAEFERNYEKEHAQPGEVHVSLYCNNPLGSGKIHFNCFTIMSRSIFNT